MELIIIGLSAFLVSGITLYTGFGLGTLLLPVFALFFPLRTAIAVTALVHVANALFKFLLAGKHADKTVVLRFGIPAVISALGGAALSSLLPDTIILARYTIGGYQALVTPLKTAVALVMLGFAVGSFLPFLKSHQFDRKWLPAGGIASGFFGGFSGHQGAIRSAFLVNAGISAQEFVGTNASIGFMVDLARIIIYGLSFLLGRTNYNVNQNSWLPILIAVLSAFAGVLVSIRFLHAVTKKTVRILTGVFLTGLSLALGAGLI